MYVPYRVRMEQLNSLGVRSEQGRVNNVSRIQIQETRYLKLYYQGEVMENYLSFRCSESKVVGNSFKVVFSIGISNANV